MKSFNICFIFFTILILSSCNEPKSDNFQITDTDLQSGVKLKLDSFSFNKILLKRNQALKKNILLKAKDDYVNGFLIANNKKIPVKARLKGDLVDHFKTNRWSFRIVTQKGKVLNHKKFSIQGVHTRAYLNEWIFHELLKKEGVINLQYKFYPFSVNDTLKGIYALESYFDNYLLERYNKPIGPILKFNEDDFWGQKKYKGFENRDDLLMKEARIKICNKKWCKKNDNITKKAINLLDQFRLGRIPFDQIFDKSTWAKYIAVNEIMNSNHALRWHNLRFYYNPSIHKFEPIGFDSGSWMSKEKRVFHLVEKMEFIHQLMIRDQDFLSLIKIEMKRLAEKAYLEDFFDTYKDDLEDLEELMKLEKEQYNFHESPYYLSQKRILNQLND